MAAGDALVFLPNELAHRGTSPIENTCRYMLLLTLIPSPYCWRKAMDNILSPGYELNTWINVMEIIERYESKQGISSKMLAEDLILFPEFPLINSWNQIKIILDTIFNDQNYSSWIFQQLKQANNNNLSGFQELKSLYEILLKSFSSSLNWNALNSDDIKHLQALVDYNVNFDLEVKRYSDTNKPNPNAIFWPNPSHPEKPLSQYEILPYVSKTPIMNSRTLIGSAGSCFAVEIAKILQCEEYNYYVAERNDDPNSGISVDGYNCGDQFARFPANYGIIFNTPCFRQLAEKAFGLREFKKLLFWDKKWDKYVDPYREGILFDSPASYLIDYDKHVRAIRESFINCEVFIITLGLNECWEFINDGSVLSRNPSKNGFPLVKHRTLTIEENVANIKTMFNIIKQHNPQFKLIVTLSPVPFLATGLASHTHVITANCHSKAILRIAADEIVNSHKDIYYLPSYEYITYCAKDPWELDQRHVKPEAVKNVVAMFKEIFVAD